MRTASLVSKVQTVQLLVNLIPSDTVSFQKQKYSNYYVGELWKSGKQLCVLNLGCHVYFKAFWCHMFLFICEHTVCTEGPGYLLTSL